ncbi:MAG: hypothetical protein RLZZ393_708 [Pseudomonadota bacterium]|jgi:DNA-binding protein H-NS
MPRLSADKIKARIAELQKELAKAEKTKEPAIRKVVALMKKLGVTVADLKGGAPVAAPAGRKAKSKGGKSAGKRGPAPIKYKDDAGNTWSGRGKTPRWLADAEKAGKKREQFAV